MCIAVGLAVLLPLSRWFLSRKNKSQDDTRRTGKSLAELVREYGVPDVPALAERWHMRMI